MRNRVAALIALCLGFSPCPNISGQAEHLDLAVINAGLDPANPQVVRLVAHFRTHGLHLEHDRIGWWRVTLHASPDIQMSVSLRAFPESASVEQMQDSLTLINLGYMLNAKAHVAMSYPSIIGGSSQDMKDARFLSAEAELKRVFHEF